MDRAAWVKLLQKRLEVVPDSLDALPGETTYHIPDKQVVVVIQSPTPPGALRAESLTDCEECLVINRGQGRRSFVDWNKVDAICTAEN